MGIKSNYTKFLKKYAGEDVFQEVSLSKFAYQKVAIDTTLYLYKYKAAIGDNWISGFFNLIKCFRENNIHSVFVFDGLAPIEKKEEQETRVSCKRKLESTIDDIEKEIVKFRDTGIVSPSLGKFSNSETFDITAVEEKLSKKLLQIINVYPEDFSTLKRVFDIMKIPYYTAPTEAEKLCSKLCIDGEVAAVLSDDTDVLVYGSPVTLSKLNTYTGTCVVVEHVNLLSRLKLSPSEFLDHAIMCGTDYNKNIARVGSCTAYSYITSNRTIESIRDDLKIDVSVLNHEVVRKLFTEFENHDKYSIQYCGTPDFEALKKILHEKQITINVHDLENTFEKKDVVFVEI